MVTKEDRELNQQRARLKQELKPIVRSLILEGLEFEGNNVLGDNSPTLRVSFDGELVANLMLGCCRDHNNKPSVWVEVRDYIEELGQKYIGVVESSSGEVVAAFDTKTEAITYAQIRSTVKLMFPCLYEKPLDIHYAVEPDWGTHE